MKRFRVLPLGVDVGSTRLRIALCESNGTETRLRAVATRDLSVEFLEDHVMAAALFEEIFMELGVRKTQCVTSMGPPYAFVRNVSFPKMSWAERLRAAQFEATRVLPSLLEQHVGTVRVHPVERERGLYAIGIADGDVLARRVALLRSARLRVTAVDFDGFALRRLFSIADAVLDIGALRSTLHVFTGTPASYHIPAGGALITSGIARDLSIDEASAERRKRILGIAGAGVSVREELVRKIADAVANARMRSNITRLALVGNGARLPGLTDDLEEATGSLIEMPVPSLLESAGYPEDVLRVAAPDWSLAAALAIWSTN